MLEEAKKDIDNASDHFPLAKASAKWKAATWYAEIKNQQRYGGKRAITSDGKKDSSGSL